MVTGWSQKEEIHALLLDLLQKEGLKKSDIANETGITAQEMYNFIHKKHLGTQKLMKLHDVIHEFKHKIGMSVKEKPATYNATGISPGRKSVADDLKSVYDFLMNVEISNEQATIRLVTLIEGYHNILIAPGKIEMLFEESNK